MRIRCERLTQARELAGMTKTDLAERLGVTPAAVAQWENGTKKPTCDNLIHIARQLGIPPALLSIPKPDSLETKGPVTFRAWNTAKTRAANRKASRFAEMTAEVFFWIEDKISLPATVLPEPSDEECGEGLIERRAQDSRRAWGLGTRPIHKLGELFESKGIIITRISFDDTRFDAFSRILHGRPFIFLGNDKDDRARSRFDAAHELGHLILHQHLTENDLRDKETLSRVEAEANSFAGAFLMPSETFAADVFDTTLDGFLDLKPKWAVSVQAMVRRALDIGLIDHPEYEALCRQISSRGWRRARGEPLDDVIPEVTSTVARKALEVLQTENIILPCELPSELPFPPRILSAVFGVSEEEFQPNPQVKRIIPFETAPS